MSSKRIIFFICLVIFLFSNTSEMFCAEKKLKIAVIVHKPEGFHNAFWDALQMGARKAGAKMNVEIYYSGIPLEYGDKRVEGQTAVFDKYIRLGVNGIIFTPCDRIGMIKAVKNAILKGVKVVAIDSPIESNLPSSVLATNNYEGGLIAAKHMIKLLNGKGRLIMMRHPAKDNKATRDRELAFIEGIKQYGPNIKIVSTDDYGGATIDKDYPRAKNLLQKYENIDGAYAVSGTGIIGFIMALEELNLSKKVKLIGWDASPDAIKGLKNGVVSAIIQQNPEKMGHEGIISVVNAIKGKRIKKKVDTGVTLVTLENIDSQEIKDLIFPDFGDWIK